MRKKRPSLRRVIGRYLHGILYASREHKKTGGATAPPARCRELFGDADDWEQVLLDSVAEDHIDHGDEGRDGVLLAHDFVGVVFDGEEVMTVAFGEVGFQEADIVIESVDEIIVVLRGFERVENNRDGRRAVFVEAEFKADIVIEGLEMHALGDEAYSVVVTAFLKLQFVVMVQEHTSAGFDIHDRNPP